MSTKVSQVPCRGTGAKSVRSRSRAREDEEKGLAVSTPTLAPADLSAALGPARCLACRECGAEYALGARYACDDCFGPLEVSYDFGTVTRAQIEAGPANMWRYAPLLPVPADVASGKNLLPGFTHLIKTDNLATELGMTNLWVKDDSGNPTHSFKDRVVAVALEAARAIGFTTVACASTGNLANAVAAAAAGANRAARRPRSPRSWSPRRSRGAG
jgi:threonine synthase